MDVVDDVGILRASGLQQSGWTTFAGACARDTPNAVTAVTLQVDQHYDAHAAEFVLTGRSVDGSLNGRIRHRQTVLSVVFDRRGLPRRRTFFCLACNGLDRHHQQACPCELASLPSESHS